MDISFHPIFVALYPEIHYTFDLFFSRLGHGQPEILVDCPHRIDPGQSLPVLCLIKHANRYPISLHSIHVSITYGDHDVEEHRVWSTPTAIKEYLWYNTFHLYPRKEYSGDVRLSARIEFEREGRSCTIINHNYRGSLNHALRVHIASEHLPTEEGWYSGEAHTHSFYSDDQIEFGAPVPALSVMARAMGLRWVAVTDHSYDLDDTFGHIFRPDTSLSKWAGLKTDIEQENHDGDMTLILGEEVSCGNSRSKNIHVLAYGMKDYIPGSGDGAERWFRTRPEHSLRTVLRQIRDDGGIAFAAHPEERFTPGERFILRRGHWEDADYELSHYSGLQFWNGRRDVAFQRGYKRWIEMLLRGRHIYCLGGNDAHGDFNVFRQIRIPLMKMIDSPFKIFGKVRTCLFCEGPPDQASVLGALRNGRIIVTSGPFVTGRVENEAGEVAQIGQTISGNKIQVRITARSTDECGGLEQIILCQGNLKKKTEEKRKFVYGTDFSDQKTIDMNGIPLHVESPMYLRIEAVSHTDGEYYHAYTNPIWIEPE